MLILVVDDEAMVRDALIRVLTDLGHRTCWAGSGGSALRLMRSEKPDLVLLDMMMPGIDGWQVLRSKVTDETIRSIPVIIISALADADVRGPTGPTVTGAILILGKPFDRAELETAIAMVATR